MSDRIRDAYREQWTRLLRETFVAVLEPSEDARHLRNPAVNARHGGVIPLSDRRDQFVLAALPDMVKAYAEQKTVAGRRALAEPLLAWVKVCAELLGVSLVDPGLRPLPYKDD